MTDEHPDTAALLRAACELLDGEFTCGVATVDGDGRPWACNLYYALASGEGLRLVVLTDPESAHVAHWNAGSELALTVFAHPDRPRSEVRGLQMRAARRAAGEPEAAAYLERFPEAESISGQSHHVLAVSRLRLLDRAQGIDAELSVGDAGA